MQGNMADFRHLHTYHRYQIQNREVIPVPQQTPSLLSVGPKQDHPLYRRDKRTVFSSV